MLRDLLLASRPLSWINTAYPFALALLLAGGGVDLTLVIGALFFLVPYNLAMYGINDVFDYESDMRNPRKGGAEGHIAAPGTHRMILLAAILLCLPFLVYLVVVGGLISTIVLAVSMFALVAYSAPPFRFKEVPFLDSITSSTHFSSPAWFGIALAVTPAWDGSSAVGSVATGASAAGGWGIGPDIWLVLVAFFLWGVAAQAFGAVQDIGPDREGGLASIATVIGARATVGFSTAGFVVAGLCVGLAGFLTGPAVNGWLVGLCGILALPYAINTGRFLSVTDAGAARTNQGWKVFLWLNYLVGFFVTLAVIGLVM